MDDTKFTGPEDVQEFLEWGAFVQGFVFWYLDSFCGSFECNDYPQGRLSNRISH